MRLTQDQQTVIRSASAEAFGAGVGVWLFGSRADDRKKGGDIDLLICPGSDATDQLFSRKIRLLTQLERALGERKIDIVIEAPHDTRPIIEIAHATGVQIK
ncbi:MAG: nucleotidyltransferase domain-containing protein [Polaromonas sp.]